jgi:arginine utilization protein RocB
MTTMTTPRDREIHTSTDEIIGAREQQARRPSRARRWLFGAGAAAMVAGAAVAISLVGGTSAHTTPAVPAGSTVQTANPAVPAQPNGPSANPAVPSQPNANPAVPSTPGS